MGAPRKFDHDEAQRRWHAGESLSTLAREFDVSETAVWFVVSPRGRARKAELQERAKAPTGTCWACGGPQNKISARRGHACAACANKMKVKAIGDRVYCPVCDLWLVRDEFRPTKKRPARGVAAMCRSCETAARRRYRHAHPEQEAVANKRRAERRRRAKAA
jgi:hypothetical protein